ncbi:MAG: hypothetical protein CVV49_00335 [Spirochaetae bacterium HGW-Spirochaetae-5]|nr:MAG: hypothetical protein CVV49_00335 [Spirochaetae bacterium HGW-Spirochaetae-5]
MKFFSKMKSGFIPIGLFLITLSLLFVFLSGENSVETESTDPDCVDCTKKKAGLYLGESTADSTAGSAGDDTGYLGRIFSLLKSGNGNSDENTIIEKDPEKDKTVIEINALSENVCNEENLPGDIWISPKMIEKDASSHKKELEKLIAYCSGLKNGKTTSAEKKEYYQIKIKLLEERRDLIRYYIDTLDGQIEDTNEKKIAEMEDRKSGDVVTPEEEKQNNEIEAEMNRFFEEASTNSNKVIEQINSVINNYKKELNKL